MNRKVKEDKGDGSTGEGFIRAVAHGNYFQPDFSHAPAMKADALGGGRGQVNQAVAVKAVIQKQDEEKK